MFHILIVDDDKNIRYVLREILETNGYTATEAKIRQTFATDLKGMTKIIIAQRISSVIDSDKIIVIDDGKIVGIGKHSDLIDKCDTYSEIYYSQMDKKEAVR